MNNNYCIDMDEILASSGVEQSQVSINEESSVMKKWLKIKDINRKLEMFLNIMWPVWFTSDMNENICLIKWLNVQWMSGEQIEELWKLLYDVYVAHNNTLPYEVKENDEEEEKSVLVKRVEMCLRTFNLDGEWNIPNIIINTWRKIKKLEEEELKKWI